MRKLGLLLVTLGLFLVMLAVWPIIDNGPEHEHQRRLVERYEAAVEPVTKQVGVCVPPKDVVGVLRIPSLKLVQPIVASTELSVLDSGVVGSYPGTPGKGNYALAGHRITNGEPFRNLPDLDAGDKVIVEANCKSYTFIVTDNFEVPMTDTSVLEQTDRPTITLVTCASLFQTDNRTVVVGRLAS